MLCKKEKLFDKIQNYITDITKNLDLEKIKNTIYDKLSISNNETIHFSTIINVNVDSKAKIKSPECNCSTNQDFILHKTKKLNQLKSNNSSFWIPNYTISLVDHNFEMDKTNNEGSFNELIDYDDKTVEFRPVLFIDNFM